MCLWGTGGPLSACQLFPRRGSPRTREPSGPPLTPSRHLAPRGLTQAQGQAAHCGPRSARYHLRDLGKSLHPRVGSGSSSGLGEITAFFEPRFYVHVCWAVESRVCLQGLYSRGCGFFLTSSRSRKEPWFTPVRGPPLDLVQTTLSFRLWVPRWKLIFPSALSAGGKKSCPDFCWGPGGFH